MQAGQVVYQQGGHTGGMTVTPPGGVPIAADFVEILSDPTQLVGIDAVEIRASSVYGTLEIAHGELAELAAIHHPGGNVRLESHCGSDEREFLQCGVNAGQWFFTPDFSAMGASTYTLDLHHQGQMVFSQSGMSGPAVSAASWEHFDKKTTEHADGSVTTE